MVIIFIDFPKAFTWPKRPVKFVVGYITFIKKDFDKHESYFVVVWLFGITQFIRVPQKWKQKLSALGAEILGFRTNLIFGNFYKLVGDFLGIINPRKIGVYAEDQEVHKTYDVVSSAQRHLRKSILTRKNHVTFEKYILLKRQMVALVIEICG